MFEPNFNSFKRQNFEPHMADVLVSGAGGFIARNLRKILASNGFDLLSISRGAIKTAANETALQTSGYDEECIVRHAAGCHTAIHLVGSGSQDTLTSCMEANRLVTDRVIQICKDASIPHIIYLSGLGVSHKAVTDYFISKYLAEQDIIQSGLTYTILRPSYVIGYDDYLSMNLERQISAGVVTIPGSGRYRMQPISISDTVNVLKGIVNGYLPNRILDLVGPEETTFERFVRMFAGPHIRISYMDAEEAYRQAIHGGHTPYSIEELNIMMGGYTGDHTTIEQSLGMRFQTISGMLATRRDHIL